MYFGFGVKTSFKTLPLVLSYHYVAPSGGFGQDLLTMRVSHYELFEGGYGQWALTARFLPKDETLAEANWGVTASSYGHLVGFVGSIGPLH